MRSRFPFALVMTLALGLPACGGGDHTVGQPCTPDFDAGVQVLYEPTPDCPSNVCAWLSADPPSQSRGVCTARCEKPEDCEGERDAGCEEGYTCAVATVYGPRCCLGYCYCRDYLRIVDGGVPYPSGCDPVNQQNTCCNLPGRDPCED